MATDKTSSGARICSRSARQASHIPKRTTATSGGSSRVSPPFPAAPERVFSYHHGAPADRDERPPTFPVIIPLLWQFRHHRRVTPAAGRHHRHSSPSLLRLRSGNRWSGGGAHEGAADVHADGSDLGPSGARQHRKRSSSLASVISRQPCRVRRRFGGLSRRRDDGRRYQRSC
jgi:hypothetical protein